MGDFNIDVILTEFDTLDKFCDLFKGTLMQI